jgi:hypothetical protein
MTNCLSFQCLCFPVCSKVSLYVSCLLLSVSGFPVLVPVFLSVSEYFYSICIMFVTLCQWFSCPCRCLPVISKVSLYASPSLVFLSLSRPSTSISCLLLSGSSFPVLVPVSLFLPLCPHVFLSLYLFHVFPSLPCLLFALPLSPTSSSLCQCLFLSVCLSPCFLLLSISN